MTQNQLRRTRALYYDLEWALDLARRLPKEAFNLPDLQRAERLLMQHATDKRAPKRKAAMLKKVRAALRVERRLAVRVHSVEFVHRNPR
jgi:hypothetical protein